MTWPVLVLLALIWGAAFWRPTLESVRFHRAQRRARAAVAPPPQAEPVYVHNTRPAPIDGVAEGWLNWRD